MQKYNYRKPVYKVIYQDAALPMGMSEIYDRSIHLYKQSFASHMAYSAIIAGIAMAGNIFVFMFMGMFFAFTSLLGAAALVFISALIATAGVAVVISILSAGPMIISRQAFYGHRQVSLMRYLPAAIGRVSLTVVAIIIMCLPFGLAAYFVVVNYSNINIISPWLTFILFCILLIAFIIYINIFSLSIAVSVFERSMFFSSIVRSLKLLRGSFWKILFARIMWIITTFLLTYVLQSVFYIAIALIAEFSGINETTGIVLGLIAVAAMGISSLAAYFVFIPLDGTFHALLYLNQRLKNEGLDIEIKLERLTHDIL